MLIEGMPQKSLQDRWAEAQRYQRNLWEGREKGSDGSVAAEDTQESPRTKRVQGAEDCASCENRKYQDGSNDMGVSFKVPTKVAPEQAASAVRSHEAEHVGRNQDKARREGREVVSQSVTYHNAICPECGDAYVSGGTTRTTTRGVEEPQQETAPEKQKKALDVRI